MYVYYPPPPLSSISTKVRKRCRGPPHKRFLVTIGCRSRLALLAEHLTACKQYLPGRCKPDVPRPGIAVLRGSVVLRLRSCIIRVRPCPPNASTYPPHLSTCPCRIRTALSGQLPRWQIRQQPRRRSRVLETFLHAIPQHADLERRWRTWRGRDRYPCRCHSRPFLHRWRCISP